MKAPIRMRDIARKCGVSVATVSRVLNGQPGVGATVAAEVRAVLEKLHYDPLRNIPALRRMKTRTLRVITPFYGRDSFMADYFFIKALNGVKGAVMERGYEMILSTEDELGALVDPADSSGLLQASGVVMISPGHEYERKIGQLLGRDMPVALINRRSAHSGVICVYENRKAGIRKAVEHLKGLGHTDIRFAGPEGGLIRELETAREVFAETGLPSDPAHLIPCSCSSADADIAGMVKTFHMSGAMPGAMMFYEDERALHAMKILAQLGYRVPQDVAVIGYDNIELCTKYHPELTSIDCPVDRMAARGTGLLIDRIEAGAGEGVCEQMENELVIRDSCGWRLRHQ